MTTTIRLKQIGYWAFRVLVDMWDEVLTRWSSSRTMCCVPSRSSSWSPCSVSPSAAAWCHSPPRSTTDPLHFRIAEYLRRNIENTSTRETVSTSANIARTCQMMESLMNTALRSVSRRGAKRLRVEISKTVGGEVVTRAWIACSVAAPRVRVFPAPEWMTSEKIASRVHRSCAEKHTE